MHLRLTFMTACAVVITTSVGAAEVETSQAAACDALNSASFEDAADNPVRIISASYVEDGNESLKQSRYMFDKRSIVQGLPIAADEDVPPHCRIEGYVAPAVKFLILLPDQKQWNQRALYAACDAFCGAVDDDQNVAGLVNGFASITSDGGHINRRPFDGVWGSGNREGEIDFGYRASHVAAQTIKAVSKAYYGAEPSYSYITGFSKGGHAGIMSALKYPGDYDGALSRAPVVRYQEINSIKMPWIVKANTRADGTPILLASDVPLIHKAAIASCDEVDGVKDGIIDNPRKCNFDPGVLLCKEGASEGCLTQEQVGALRKFYEKPKNAAGRIAYPYALEVGSELDWPGFYAPRSVNDTPYAEEIARTFLRYMAFPDDPGASFDYLAFDPVKDRKKLEKMKAVYDADGIEFDDFRDAGGKLLVLHGFSDGAVTAQMTIDWYEKVIDKYGEEQAQEFARLFVLPGNKHGGSPADGPNINNSLAALMNWVESGEAPSQILLRDETRQRVVFPYPLATKYNGEGDINDPTSYQPVRTGE